MITFNYYILADQFNKSTYEVVAIMLFKIEEKYDMEEEINRSTLSGITERLFRLENEISELRQLMLLQKTHWAKPIDLSSPLPANLDSPSLAEAKTVCWEVTCLGNFHLRIAGQDFMLSISRRAQSILKYLLASPGYAASTEVLIECFWPRVDPEAGLHSLQVAVHALRRSLRGCGPHGSNEVVLFCNNRYFLNPSIDIVRDVDRFRAAYERGQHAVSTGHFADAKQAFEAACALYREDYHAECDEEWISSRRLALRDMRLAVLNKLGTLYGLEKDWELAIDCYRKILIVDCYREDIYRQLMDCFAACGRQADVKRTYLTCMERLQSDLHLAPAPETTMLYQQLTQQTTLLDSH